MQVVPGFRLHYAIGATVEEGVDIPLMDDGQHFYLSYHLKRVYNSNDGFRHLHRTMLQGKMGLPMARKERLCVKDANPPVNVVETDYYGRGVSLSTSAYNQSRH